MEDDEDSCRRFGTALDPLYEDDMPSKKPIGIEDQIVTDENGKRRFHGAFTGGFSAGYWNTVGSSEGWKPTEFKSSRSEKAAGKKTQRPEDFMDDEDLGEFGIAPQRIQTTNDFSSETKDNSRKRKLKINDGPIPGVPVLHTLLEAPRNNIAIRLLKRMGWKEGQGVGARLKKSEKKVARDKNLKEIYLMEKYGCDSVTSTKSDTVEDGSDDDSDLSDVEITFAPDDYESFVVGVKDNTFGLGYSGLNRDPILNQQTTHIDLFGGQFQVLDKNNKKFSISGQAFGVGALEEDDDDIYAKDDLTRYDYSLEEKKKVATKKVESVRSSRIIEGFVASQSATKRGLTKEIFSIELSIGWKPRNWNVRQSRFDALDETIASRLRNEDCKTKGLGRHDLTPDERGNILEGKQMASTSKQSEKPKQHPSWLELVNSKNFTKGETINDDAQEHKKLQVEAAKITENLAVVTGTFRPFATDSDKQERYEKFLSFKESAECSLEDFLKSIQPLSFNEFEREMEKKEFIQARHLYRPLSGLMCERFVTEAQIVKEVIKEKEKKAPKEIVVKRTKVMWKPCSKLCMRFNIPEPFGEAVEDKKASKKKSKYSVFDYFENNLNDRKNFVTPVIIPPKIKTETEIKERQTSRGIFEASLRESTEYVMPVTMAAASVIPTGSVKKPPIRKPPLAKTDLEKKIVETKHVHPSEKKDLFKAIFESSDEEENAGTTTKDNESTLFDEAQSKSIEALLLKSASQINILRNNAPPTGIFACLAAPKQEPPPVPAQSEPPPPSIEEKIVEEAVELKSTPEIPSNKLPPSTSIIKFRSKEERRAQVEEEDDIEATQIFGPKPPPKLQHAFAIQSEKGAIRAASDDKDEDKVDKKLKKLLKNEKLIEKWVEKRKDEDRKKKKKHKEKDKDSKKKKHKKEKKQKK